MKSFNAPARLDIRTYAITQKDTQVGSDFSKSGQVGSILVTSFDPVPPNVRYFGWRCMVKMKRQGQRCLLFHDSSTPIWSSLQPGASHCGLHECCNPDYSLHTLVYGGLAASQAISVSSSSVLLRMAPCVFELLIRFNVR